MKKFASIFLASGQILRACSSDDETTETAADSADTTETAENSEETSIEEAKGENLEVDKGLFNVEVTLPASFFEGEDMEQVAANAEAEGIDEAVVNGDGSGTYKMSENKH